MLSRRFSSANLSGAAMLLTLNPYPKPETLNHFDHLLLLLFVPYVADVFWDP